MHHWKKGMVSLSLALLLALAAGCSTKSDSQAGNQTQPTQPTKGIDPIAQEPVHLKMLQYYANISDDEFQHLMVEPVVAKYPKMSLEIVRANNPKDVDALLTGGDFPDLVFLPLDQVGNFKDMQVAVDLNGMIKSNNYNLGKFDPQTIQDIASVGDAGQMLALPFSSSFSVLYYNKDIFDKFGVAYPKDGMTWEQAIELGKKVGRLSDGVQYKGLDPLLLYQFASTLSLPSVNPATGKANINTDGWKRVFQMFQTIQNIPGNSGKPSGRNAFMKDRILAMIADFHGAIGQLEEQRKQGNEMNWDMATYPSFTEAPGVSMANFTHDLMISATSKHQKEAFAVMSLLTDSDVQLLSSHSGRLTSLADPKIRQSYGTDLETLRGKHLDAIFKTKPARLPVTSKYDLTVRPVLNKAMNSVLSGDTDINSALRAAEDEANKAIEAASN